MALQIQMQTAPPVDWTVQLITAGDLPFPRETHTERIRLGVPECRRSDSEVVGRTE